MPDEIDSAPASHMRSISARSSAQTSMRAVHHRCTQGGPLAVLLEVHRKERCVYYRNLHSAQLSVAILRCTALLNVSTKGERVLGGRWRLRVHERAVCSVLVHMARVLGAHCVWLYTVSGPRGFMIKCGICNA